MAGRIPLTRSEIMSRIRGTNTLPEQLLRRALWSTGLRFRIQWRHPQAGRIDIAVPRAQLAILVDGCFWHGCPVHGVQPKSNQDFWTNKLAKNATRDARQTLCLVRDGWTVVRCWEHEIEDADALLLLVARIRRLAAAGADRPGER